jgi:hypothetical protein
VVGWAYQTKAQPVHPLGVDALVLTDRMRRAE